MTPVSAISDPASLDCIEPIDARVTESSTWRSRVFGLHRDERAQVLPLIFFLGIAFFTSVVLVINTGRSTNRRIKAQNGVDAAAVSGANAMARGMNYVASNNTTTSKLLASIAILRSFEPAIKASRIILKVWRTVGTTLQGMGAVPYVGPALVAAGNVIVWKVQLEEGILDALENIVDPIKDAWDDDGDGIAWTLMKGLHYLAVAIVYATPVIAQYTAYVINERNIEPESGFAWLIPVYPALPVCQGKYGDYYDWTKHWAEEYAKPIYIAGAILLTLSLFPLTYYVALQAQLQALFTGASTGDVEVEDPDQKKIKEHNDRMDQLKAELNNTWFPKRDDITARLNGAAPYNVDPHPAGGLRANYARNENPRKDYEDELELSTPFPTEDNATTVADHIEWRKNEIEWRGEEVEVIQKNRTEGPIDPPDGELGGLQGNSQNKKEPKPWLLKGHEYPHSFLVFAMGTRTVEEPIVQVHFKRQMSTAFAYASAMVYNPTSADMFTADWRARLIRADANNLGSPFNPVGSLPSGCDGSDAGGTKPTGNSTASGEEPSSDLSLLNDFLDLLNKH